MTEYTYKIDVEATIKDLKKKIKDITFQRQDLLRVQRDYRKKLNELKSTKLGRSK